MIAPHGLRENLFVSLPTYLAVFMPDQQGDVQEVRCALCSLNPHSQVLSFVLQQNHRHLVVAADHFGHLRSLGDRQEGGLGQAPWTSDPDTIDKGKSDAVP